MYTIHVRDGALARKGPLQILEGKVILKYCDVGTWTFTIDALNPRSKRIEPGGGIIAVNNSTGAEEFSGILTSPVNSAPADSPERNLEVFGYTDEIALQDRIMYPDPALPDTSQTTQSHYDSTGPAETVMKTAVNLQAGPGALVDRRTNGLIIEATQARGITVSLHVRYSPNLLETLKGIAAISGLGWKVVQSGTNIVFRVYESNDFTRRAVFSRDRGSLADYTYGLTAPVVTDVTVAGQGDLTARQIEHRSNALGRSNWGGRRIEQFVDRRDTDSIAVLLEAGDEALAEGSETANLEFTPLELVNLKYGTDYHLGDIVTVKLESGVTITDKVRQVTLTWEKGRVTAVPLIGTEASKDTKEPSSVRIIKDLRARIAKLEAEK